MFAAFRDWVKKKSIALAMSGLSLLCFAGFAFSCHEACFLPEPYCLKLPEFKGAVYPASQVSLEFSQAQSHAIQGISSWGADAIMTYERSGQSVRVRAMRLDAQKKGGLQTIEEYLPLPKNAGWGITHRAAKIEKREGFLEVFPSANYSGISVLAALSFALTMISLLFWSDPPPPASAQK